MDFNYSIHLVGRHPEIVNDHEFQTWNRKHGSQVWHETHPDKNGIYSVIIQSLDRSDIIAFRVMQQPEVKEQQDLLSQIIDVKVFDLIQKKASKTYALELARLHFAKENVLSVRPVVYWGNKTLSWEIEVNEGNEIKRFLTDNLKSLTPDDSFQIAIEEKSSFAKFLNNDWLEENELHHLNKYYSTALDWANGGNTVSDKAFRIWLKVRQKLAYDANITHIEEFTWADNLVIDTLGYRGICDEWAIIQITMLRALGIPAVMKFMIFNYNGKQAGHACLEWSDNGNWKHMDALWSAFDNRAVYRQNGCSNVTLMDANFPRDNRYNGTAWGVPDLDLPRKTGQLITRENRAILIT